MAECPCCKRPIKAEKKGAHMRRFCSDACRARYHKALRLWAEHKIEIGVLSIERLMDFERRIRQEGGASD